MSTDEKRRRADFMEMVERLMQQHERTLGIMAGLDSADRPSEVLAIPGMHEMIREVVESHRATNPRVFGSAAMGTDTPESDLDIIVDSTPEASPSDLDALAEKLQGVLLVRVDLVTPERLPDHIRAAVLKEAKPI